MPAEENAMDAGIPPNADRQADPGTPGPGADPVSPSAPAPPATAPSKAGLPGRLVSLDAYRGFIIQPAFLFMVGVAMPYSYASRQARGESPAHQALHAATRSLILVLLGVLLASNGRPESDFSFTIVLPQIGLGYFFVFLLLGRGPRVQALAAAGLLVAYWMFFVLYPAPGPGFDWKAAGVSDNVEKLTGLFGHWNKNSIAMYLMFMLIRGWFRDTLKTHLGPSVFGGTYGPLVECAAVLFCLWLVCLWMYRRRIFLRI